MRRRKRRCRTRAIIGRIIRRLDRLFPKCETRPGFAIRSMRSSPRGRSRKDLSPVPAADKSTLLRRVYLDLVGLPPTREELTAFLADDSPNAYEAVVDRLLASPQYGERWARHWMDVWRYSDWSGYKEEIRNSARHIWRWRDWIVESLNADKGYDRMATEMLAGDELAPTDPNTLRATGFLVRNWDKFNRDRLAGSHGRAHGQGVSRRHDELLPLPRPQVRSDQPGGVLPVSGDLRAARSSHRARARSAGRVERRLAAGLRFEAGCADVFARARRREAAQEGRGHQARRAGVIWIAAED